MRESKDNLDASLHHILQRYIKTPLLFWYTLTNGADAHVGNIQLSCPGIYVALHESTIHLPRNMSSLQAFKRYFITFVSVVFDLEQTAMMIKKPMDSMNRGKDSSINRQADSEDRLAANYFLLSTQPTYNDPLRELASLAVLPSDLFEVKNTTSTTSVPSSPCHSYIDPGQP